MTKMFLAGLLAFTAAPAFAQLEAPVSAPVSVAVPLAGIDLNTAEGQRTLDQRLRHAAADICGSASPADLKGQNALRRCRTETFAHASAAARAHIAASSSGQFALAAR
ncbi:UrcA family protein [Sphingomonas xanthus]|uniref:UrcA family protein n=1 Tax=Sphingomonas xanthus TaxID=2594473 RepID=A0A516IPQ9_9SPHN|nr:UrcA family protein [Sphingomonas xanthus]QDP18902.1 UrcA family protein [Sphingomonas xanthus]